MQATPHTEKIDDLSALAWVQDELRRSLEVAHKALRRYVKEAEALAGSDVDAVDPGVLRQARSQLHQGAGALELVGLSAAASLLRASENAVGKLGARPKKLNHAAVDTVEQASFALLDYLQRMLAGKPVSPLALFPQYRAVQELAGADRVHPADLWPSDWQWRELPADPSAVPRVADAHTRTAVETQILSVMRQPAGPAAATMSDLFAGLGAGAGAGQLGSLWQLAAAFFEGQAQGLLKPDVYSKRIASRLLAQLRMGERDPGAAAEVSERLAQDLLFFCAQADSPGDGRQAPRLAAVRQAWGLSHAAPENYESSRLGRFDPAWIAQAKKRVGTAKDSWSAVAGGELHRLSGLQEQFSLVGDSLKRLYPSGEQLADALQDAVMQTVQAGQAPLPELAMEVATSVLWLDASLEDADFDDPEQGARVQRLAQRINALRQGQAAEPLEAWMEELYRRVSDRQTMGSVVQELRASLSESEKLIDQYFRNPQQRELLIPVPNQLQAMRGVLSVLGMDQASHAVLRMRDEVDALAQTEVDPARAAQTGVFDRLAGNLGALGFLIDMLSVQPQMAKSLFVFDADEGTLRSVVGTSPHRAPVYEATPAPTAAEPRLIEQAQSLAFAAAHPEVSNDDVSRDLERLSHEALVADQSVLAETISTAQAALDHAGDDEQRLAVREELAQAMADFVATQSGAESLEPPQPRSAPLQSPATPAGQTGLEDDVEMREIFLEEAREVLGNAAEALQALEDTPEDLNQLTTVRRAFHTLKGSSRMVGLTDFGDAGWACEQLYNARLADAPRADDDLLAFSHEALAYLGDWVDHIAERREGGHNPRAVQHAADVLRERGQREALPLPTAAPLAERVPDLPLASDLDLAPLSTVDFDISQSPADALAGLEMPLEPLPEVSFDIDLGALEAVSPADLPELGDLSTEPMPLADARTLALPVEPPLDLISLDLETPAEPVAELAPELPVAELPVAEVPEAELPLEALAPPEPDPEQFKFVGALAIPIPLFNIYLNEADEQSRRLGTELAEWALELHRPVGESAIALAHSLAGNSATVGFTDLSLLARALEHALMRSQTIGSGNAEEASLFGDAGDEIRRLLHQFAAGFLQSVAPELMERLAEHERSAAERLQSMTAEADEPIDSGSGTLPGAFEDAPSEPMPLPEIEAEAAPAEAMDSDLAPLPVAALGELVQVELKALAPLSNDDRTVITASADALDADDDIDAVDAVDAELFPIFEEEAQELLPQLASRLRDWARRPSDPSGAASCMRTLHTLKGGARLAGAMRLGEMSHRLETAIEHLLSRGDADHAEVDALQGRVDALSANFEALRSRDAAAYAEANAALEQALQAARERIEPPPPAPAPAAVTESLPEAAPTVPDGMLDEAPQEVPLGQPLAEPSPIDWARFGGAQPARPAETAVAVGHGTVRVRAPLLDRLVNQAGEVSITRSRIESDVGQIKGSLGDLTENLERLRSQLRDIELQGESQITSRMEAAKAAAQNFDPLEMDRFTRFQELTRMMAESVNDVATVQRSLQRTLQSAEDELAAQARLTRDLQDDLLRTRMIEFEGLSDRLYRVVRQAAKETGKQVRLDIVGGSIEVDRGVLDRMTGAFEHLLRNCVGHGIESPEQRVAAGKDAAGQITVSLSHEGNEVGVEFRDDGGGLNLARIRERGVTQGLLAPDAQPTDGELANLIFTPGFSTAEQVTELAGRGVGMDVVRNEVIAMGGRIETATAAGQGTSFKLVLPLTTAVTQVVMMRAGDVTVAVPSTLVEAVRRATPAEVEQAYAGGAYVVGESTLPFFWLGALLQASPRGTETGRTLSLVVIKSAQQRVVLHVDEVLGNQEVVVKNLGAQLVHLPGLAGMTLLASGAPALIYNPVALAALYGEAAWAAMRGAAQLPSTPARKTLEPEVALAPMVLVVDDSLTVRRVTQRLLVREGYRVSLAKDGLEGLERLADELPAVVLSDIEMPRMDGFDLVRNMRGDARLRELPVIMITSRIAQKHRDYAAELGVDHYLGKPYSEEDLLALVARYARPPLLAASSLAGHRG